MTISGRNIFRIVVVVVAGSALLWSHLHRPTAQAAPQAAPASTASIARASAAVKPAPPARWTMGSLTFHACELGQPNSGMTEAAWCTRFDVPEDRAHTQGRRIGLRVAIVRADAQVPARDMLVFLAGGPGQAATESAAAVEGMLKPLLAHHDLLLVDQRGTGGSNALSCDADKDAPDASPPTGAVDDSADSAVTKAAVAACLKQVETHADPRFYTTTDAVQDLEDLRQALGSPSFDVVGVSYGTRVAQQYLMHYPDAVRSVVLDGVVPDTLVLGEDFAQNLDDALKLQFARCTADPVCKQRFGDPYQTLYQLRDALRANPHMVSFRDPQSFQTVQRRLTEYSLASVVRMFAYSPLTAAVLPLSIDAAAHGDVGPLLGQAKLLSGDLSDTMTDGMQYSVICSEDADLLTPRPQDANTILGTHLIDALKTACSVWPHGTRPTDFHQPLTSAKPVLLMSGQYDPVTPPRYGEEVLKGLGDARRLVAPGQGHNVMAAGCMPTLVKHFVDDLDPKKLDARCLDRIKPTPLFIDFNGGTP